MIVKELISRLFTLLNSSGYYKGALEIRNAINSSSSDLYLNYRGGLNWYRPNNNTPATTPGETIATTDALQECYQVIQASGTPLVIQSTEFILDQVQSIEVQWVQDGPFSPVTQFPDNQFLLMAKSQSLPPTEDRPYGRIRGSFTFDVLPANYYSVNARCLCYPPDCEFTFVDVNAPVPEVVVQRDLIWLDDKIEPLLARTISKLGFNLSNGVLVQAGNQMEQKVG
jgi:hypothetical protein